MNLARTQCERSKNVVRTWQGRSMNLQSEIISFTTFSLRPAIFSGRSKVFVVFLWCDATITSKSKDSRRRNERCQRHKPSWVDFALPFAFENGHRFKTFGTNYVKW